MSVIYYKYKSEKNYDHIPFDTASEITLSNLKRQILEKNESGSSVNFDIIISNAQTGEDYLDDSECIAKNTSVIVRITPLTGNVQKYALTVKPSSSKQQKESTSTSKSIQDEDLSRFNLRVRSSVSEKTEDEKIKEFLDLTENETRRNRQMLGNDKRHRKHNRSQMGKQSSTNRKRRGESHFYKRPAGIPKSSLTKIAVEGSDNFLLALKPDEKIFDQQKERKAQSLDLDFKDFPEEFKCQICEKLAEEASTLPCCASVFCDNCIRNFLLQKSLELSSKGVSCPVCNTSISLDHVAPDIEVRENINQWKMEIIKKITQENEEKEKQKQKEENEDEKEDEKIKLEGNGNEKKNEKDQVQEESKNGQIKKKKPNNLVEISVKKKINIITKKKPKKPEDDQNKSGNSYDGEKKDNNKKVKNNGSDEEDEDEDEDDDDDDYDKRRDKGQDDINNGSKTFQVIVTKKNTQQGNQKNSNNKKNFNRKQNNNKNYSNNSRNQDYPEYYFQMHPQYYQDMQQTIPPFFPLVPPMPFQQYPNNLYPDQYNYHQNSMGYGNGLQELNNNDQRTRKRHYESKKQKKTHSKDKNEKVHGNDRSRKNYSDDDYDDDYDNAYDDNDYDNDYRYENESDNKKNYSQGEKYKRKKGNYSKYSSYQLPERKSKNDYKRNHHRDKYSEKDRHRDSHRDKDRGGDKDRHKDRYNDRKKYIDRKKYDDRRKYYERKSSKDRDKDYSREKNKSKIRKTIINTKKPSKIRTTKATITENKQTQELLKKRRERFYK
ncbi:e3 ubiquitin-protein ligase rbbp6 [Anaeramoeba flamelloides]|uniref:E3 ubiquitin-protein ligase rbbp6 n=1 Tax=Anaeramoeba flamelloides TaxID=1746091 RepID=A0ABQ8X3N2_9EUKA|nr:e3 ubiquitin-protein ligase rbbp6 [Anaeramoeba flamelloides]